MSRYNILALSENLWSLKVTQILLLDSQVDALKYPFIFGDHERK